MKKLLTLVLAAMLSLSTFALSGCVLTEEYDGKLVIGYTIYSPMNYFDESNEFVGFDTELATEVCKIINYKPEFVEIVWDNKVMDLNSKVIDCVWNGMTITDPLKEAMSITDPYLENKQVVICQASEASKYTTIDSLKSAGEVLVESGSAGNSVAEDNDLHIVTFSAQKDTLIEVKAFASKIAIIDSTMAKVLVGAGSPNADLTYVDVGFENEQFGIGFRKEDTELMNKVNDAIKTLKENGVYDEIAAKYFG